MTTSDRDAERGFQQIADAVPVLLSFVGTDLRYRLVNHAYGDWFGRSPDEFRGLHVSEVVGEETFDRLRPHFDRVLAGRNESFEVELTRPDDCLRSLQVALTPHLVNERVDGFYVAVTDISAQKAMESAVTARKRAEAESQRVSDLLQATFSSMAQGIAVFDENLELAAQNERFGEIGRPATTGLELGTPLIEVGKRVAASGVWGTGDATEMAEEQMRRWHAGQLASREEVRWLDGRRLMVDRHRLQDGCFAIVLTDVTRRRIVEEERREAERLLRTTFHTMAQGIAIFDPDLRMMAWNDRFERLGLLPAANLKRGYPLQEAYSVMAAEGVFGPGEIEKLAVRGYDAVCKGEAPAKQDLELSDGRVLEIRRYFLEGGGVAAVFSDVTEERAAEEQRRTLQRMEALGRLTGGIAHDFGNLLTVIVGSLDLALRGSSLEKVAPLLESARQAAKHGTDLTGRLLAFGSRQLLQPQRIDVCHLIREVSELISIAAGRSLEIETRLPPAVGRVFVDPGQLEDALLNLGINAKDAMNGGRGTLTLSADNVTFDAEWTAAGGRMKAGDYVRIGVSDTGAGIDPELVEQIFDPFFTTKASGEGTGLGLSIVYGFVRQSEGGIRVKSHPGQGTTFSLFLPRVD